MGAGGDAVFKQLDQLALFEPGAAQLQPHERHAHAGGGGVTHQADVVELRALAGRGPVQATHVEPTAPGLQWAAQQGDAFQVFGALERAVLAHEGG
ncbi:hypothetical protein SDC9_118065 [bioreactor metagenome]|uniref:Uncharacterized protein n=1 Tax=bioreactor metagenome TaxID=1076179 RepID=A0A645C0G9_9ZZZZ